MDKRIVGIVLGIIALVWGMLFGFIYINHYISLINDLTVSWSLADKSATIEKKSEYLDKYVGAIRKLGLTEGHSAIMFKTENNNMANNFDALLSLQERLHEMNGMDKTSFAYQVALQQLTQQEWQEATELTGQFESAYCNRYALFSLGILGWIPIFMLILIAASLFFVLV